MKKLLSILLFVSLTSFSQPQSINGISIDAPKGYVKSGNLEWKNYNNVLRVIVLERIPSSSLKLIVEQDTRYTKHYKTYDFKYNGKVHKIGVHTSNNGLIQAHLAVNKGDSCYVIMTAVEPESLNASNITKVESTIEEIYFNMGFVVPRINP